jgi:hypothetical protein
MSFINGEFIVISTYFDNVGPSAGEASLTNAFTATNFPYY